MWTFYDKYGQQRRASSTLVTSPIGMQLIFDAVVGRGQAGDPATGATSIDSNTILGGVLPATYKHLMAMIQIRSKAAATGDMLWMRFNNDSGANYDYAEAYNRGLGGAINPFAAQAQFAVGRIEGDTVTALDASALDIWIPNYVGTTFRKQFRAKGFSKNNSETTNDFMLVEAGGEWRNAAAISRLAFLLQSGAAVADGSRITLYGMP